MKHRGKGKIPLWYQLRISRDFQEEPSLALFGGLSQRTKSLKQIKKEADVAWRAGYDRVFLPWNVITHKDWEGLKALIRDNPSLWCVQAHNRHIKLFQEKAGDLFPSSDLMFDFIVEDFEEFKSFINNFHNSFQITLPAHKGLDLWELRSRLPSYLHAKTHVHFPCFHKKHSRLYTNEEMYHFLKEKWFPPPPVDVFNLSIPEDLKLEIEVPLDFYYQTSSQNSLISVIIPSYNSKKEVTAVLQNLYRQKMAKENFEVILVDDGSSDGTEKFLKTQSFLKEMNFKYIYFPRKKKHRFGDHRFRAGLARNLGVKQAEGVGLAFLDSDVLVGEDYLGSVSQLLERHPVIQHPRFHLKRGAPTDYRQINSSRHTFVKGKGYWEKFYASGENWNEKRLPWKYISTNTLCLTTALFKKVGRFRKNYTCYGFEDTDLGWRLHQMGQIFYLNDLPTYHLYRRSEFLHFDFMKRLLLSRSANIFFHNTHSLEGYKEFAHLISKK